MDSILDYYIDGRIWHIDCYMSMADIVVIRIVDIVLLVL